MTLNDLEGHPRIASYSNTIFRTVVEQLKLIRPSRGPSAVASRLGSKVVVGSSEHTQKRSAHRRRPLERSVTDVRSGMR